MNFHDTSIAAAAAIAITMLSVGAAGAQTVTPAPGYIHTNVMLSDLVQSCVAAGPGGTFVAIGPGFTGAGESIVFVPESGGERVVATDLNAVGDCAYDAVTDVLYVTDNGLEAAGALTGDTVFAVPSASTATGLSVVGLEVVPAGSIPSAASIVIDAAGDLLVSDASSPIPSSVVKVAGGAVSPFIADAFDYVGGLALDTASGDVLVAESIDPSFESQISRYDSSGAFVEIVSGPTFGHGSIDLLTNLDGRLLASGAFLGNVVSIDLTGGGAVAFAGGLTFATGLTVDEFTGRVGILSSSFVPEAEDYRVQRFTPVERLVTGKGKESSECMVELYGLELVPKKAGKPAKDAICTDGAACDADGVVNDMCRFAVGICVNVDDPRLPACSGTDVATFELKKVKPDSAALSSVALEIQSATPVTGATCSFSDGVVVPVKVKRSGAKKDGRGLVKVKAGSSDAKPLKDNDTVKLVCRPAA